VEADNLTLQGYLIWSYPALFDCDPKTVLSKWLAALKKDQASYEIYYSLAVYYYKVNDVKRASGCLDKVLKLKPDLERALVLQYHLL
jgi:Tfp pilus assembly protein PilF